MAGNPIPGLFLPPHPGFQDPEEKQDSFTAHLPTVQVGSLTGRTRAEPTPPSLALSSKAPHPVGATLGSGIACTCPSHIWSGPELFRENEVRKAEGVVLLTPEVNAKVRILVARNFTPVLFSSEEPIQQQGSGGNPGANRCPRVPCSHQASPGMHRAWPGTSLGHKITALVLEFPWQSATAMCSW